MGRIILNRTESHLVIVSAREKERAIAEANAAFQQNVGPVIEDRIKSGAIPAAAAVNLETVESGKDKGKIALTWPDAPKPSKPEKPGPKKAAKKR